MKTIVDLSLPRNDPDRVVTRPLTQAELDEVTARAPQEALDQLAAAEQAELLDLIDELAEDAALGGPPQAAKRNRAKALRVKHPRKP